MLAVLKNTNMTYKELAEVLFPDITLTMEDYEKIYPERNLKEGAKVTRIAPSPTGFLHIGTVYGAFIDKLMASPISQDDSINNAIVKSGQLSFMNFSIETGLAEIDSDTNNDGIIDDDVKIGKYIDAYELKPLKQSLSFSLFNKKLSLSQSSRAM